MASPVGMPGDPAPGPSRLGTTRVAGVTYQSLMPVMKMASPVGMAGATPPQVPRGSGRHDRVAGCYFRTNRSCRLSPAHQGDENGVACWHGRGVARSVSLYGAGSSGLGDIRGGRVLFSYQSLMPVVTGTPRG